MIDDNNDHRQNQMPQTVADIIALSNAVRSAARQYTQLHGKDQNEQKGQPEFWNAACDRPDFTQDLIRQTVLKPCTQYPKQQRQRKDQYKTNAAKNQRISDPSPDYLQHIHFILVGNSEITVQRLLQPPHILSGNRIV